MRDKDNKIKIEFRHSNYFSWTYNDLCCILVHKVFNSLYSTIYFFFQSSSKMMCSLMYMLSLFFVQSKQRGAALRKSLMLSVFWEAAADCLWATWRPENLESLLCLALAFPKESPGPRRETCMQRVCVRVMGCNLLAVLCLCICWKSDLRAVAGQAKGPGSNL